MSDPYSAFRQLQRELNIDGQGRSYRSHRCVRPKNSEVICTIIYDLDNPDPSQRIRYERPAKSDRPPEP